MSKKRNTEPFSFGIFLLIIAFIFVIMSEIAKAQDIGTNQSNDMNSPVGGNIAGGDQLAVGFSSPSFGAAVAQCVGTKASSYGFGLYGRQVLSENWWCIGSSLYQMGEYRAAALALCQRTELGALYPNLQDCEADLSEPYQEPVVEAAVVVYEDEHEELEDLHAAEIEEQQMLLADMEAKIANLESSQRISQTVVREVPLLSDSQRAKLAEVLKE